MQILLTLLIYDLCVCDSLTFNVDGFGFNQERKLIFLSKHLYSHILTNPCETDNFKIGAKKSNANYHETKIFTFKFSPEKPSKVNFCSFGCITLSLVHRYLVATKTTLPTDIYNIKI